MNHNDKGCMLGHEFIMAAVEKNDEYVERLLQEVKAMTDEERNCFFSMIYWFLRGYINKK